MRLQAIGMFHTTAILTRALTSESCGCGLIGSQKKISMSSRPDAISAPICWSPPSGPLWKQVTGRSSRVAEQPARGAGRVQDVVGEDVPVVLGPLEQVAFPVVVGDQGDALRFG